VEASLSLNKTGYVPGEPIVFDILVDNQSDYRINQVELILTQVKYVVLSYDNVQSPDYINFNPGNGQKPSWTKALPSKNDKADKSPPVKMTKRTKALP
jgi:hypothetical protein